ncbi:MAG: class I SAM-dependent methyltransferase [Chitinophagales bacterium]|nr:class I SAM-dependent methyltransferase [Chitinophagales bacterium]
MAESIDKAGEKYWTKVWKESDLAQRINVHTKSVNEYPYRILHTFYEELFKNYKTEGKTLVEIGCGNSAFLGYFAQEFGFKVSGIDYSELGCEQSRRILQRDGIKGDILLVDAFNPPAELKEKYDFVCSFGVAEHFTDTAKTLEAFSYFLKPGGILITSVPNVVGATGFLQKLMNKPVYDIHVPMDKPYLEEANKKAGLTLLKSRYFVSISFAVTLEGIDGQIPFYLPKKILLKSIRYFSKVIWIFEEMFGSLPEGKLFSAGIITAAQKPLK